MGVVPVHPVAADAIGVALHLVSRVRDEVHVRVAPLELERVLAVEQIGVVDGEPTERRPRAACEGLGPHHERLPVPHVGLRPIIYADGGVSVRDKSTLPAGEANARERVPSE